MTPLQFDFFAFNEPGAACGETWPPPGFAQGAASAPDDGAPAPMLPGAHKWLCGCDPRARARRRRAYDAYLQSDKWKQRRAACIARADGRCERCGCETDRFEIHHKHYRTFGREPLKDLEALCPRCHPGADAEREEATAEANAAALDDAQFAGWLRARGIEDQDYDPRAEREEFEQWRANREETGE
jgi:hypothetical protein